MKKFSPVIKVKTIATEQSIRLVEKTIAKTAEAGNFLTNIADVFLFITRVIKVTFSRDFEFKEFLSQCFQIGNKTLPLISVTGIIIGLVLTIQMRPALLSFGAVSLLPGMVAVSLIREMGPVITALICAGKIGSGMGAELGSMRVSEQIDAMEVSSTNPIKYLVVTRVLAANILFPMGEKVITAQKQNKIYEHFERIEEEVVGHGVHEQLHELLYNLKSKYCG